MNFIYVFTNIKTTFFIRIMGKIYKIPEQTLHENRIYVES